MRFFSIVYFAFLITPVTLFTQLSPLVVADNHRYLETAAGEPFVWIGDTNWFFARLPPETIDAIIRRRREQGYTMMLVSCREELYDGRGGPGPLGRYNEAWWAYLDDYLEKCERNGLYVGVTLGWHQLLRRYDAAALHAYGKWVGHRYRNRNNVIWLTLGEAGGFRRKKTLDSKKLRALAAGIREGDTGGKLLTVHADYRRGTSIDSIAAICDFNNWQSSQWEAVNDLPRLDDRNWTVWEAITYDYERRYDGQPKPTIDAEAWYENNKDFCGAEPFFVRRRAYFTIFAGGMGHNYGAGGIWDGLRDTASCSAAALEALDYPGGAQMEHLSRLLHGLGADWPKLRPAPELVAEENVKDYDHHRQATRSMESNLAMVYSPSDEAYAFSSLGLDPDLRYRLKWFNPRNGRWLKQERLRINGGIITLDPPGESGPGNDWVAVIDGRHD